MTVSRSRAAPDATAERTHRLHEAAAENAGRRTVFLPFRAAVFLLCPRRVERWVLMPKPRVLVRRRLQLGDLESDSHNANRGTDRGRAALERSLREYGPGRAVLIDRHGRIIAGNKTVEQAKRLHLPLRVIKTDGTHLVAVQRDDLDLATDPRAKALAIADNRVGELDLEWDVDMLKQLQADGVDLSAF